MTFLWYEQIVLPVLFTFSNLIGFSLNQSNSSGLSLLFGCSGIKNEMGTGCLLESVDWPLQSLGALVICVCLYVKQNWNLSNIPSKIGVSCPHPQRKDLVTSVNSCPPLSLCYVLTVSLQLLPNGWKSRHWEKEENQFFFFLKIWERMWWRLG